MATGVGQVATGPAKGRDRAVCSGGQNAMGCPVAFRTRQERRRDGLEKATCRAVTFSGLWPESDRALICLGLRSRNLPFWHRGLELLERRKKLDGSSSPRFLLLLGLFFTSKNPFARARIGHEDLRGSVDTTINGVDTMAQSKGRNVKKRSTSVDTRPGQVDTSDRSQRNMLTGFHLRSTLNQIVDTKCRQVDTRWLSQKACFAVWDMLSTLNHLRSTLETSPKELICQSGIVCQHTSWVGRHTPDSL
ncbi:hypothetical protein Taro_041739 [Colocasia esculenta]|uniref:Uncharacterized protein n=1 Tax=Colocasia esculenta TaxID=4460 RepID=A0A843WUG8_COLES|nr:hypothetical protein [Colocasia esculenta]